MKNIKILLLVVVLICSFIYYYLTGSSDDKSVPKNIPAVSKIEEQKTQIKEQKLATVHQTLTNKKIATPIGEVTKEASYYSDSFDVITLSDALEISPPKKKIAPLVAFQYKQGTIKNMRVGDTLVLPEIDGESIEVRTESKKITKRGNTFIRASLADGSGSHGDIIVMTEGSTSTFFSVRTSQKSYEGEVIDGVGYIYSTADMRKSVDHSISDAIRIPNTHTKK